MEQFAELERTLANIESINDALRRPATSAYGKLAAALDAWVPGAPPPKPPLHVIEGGRDG